jgi:hypothetical protein
VAQLDDVYSDLRHYESLRGLISLGLAERRKTHLIWNTAGGLWRPRILAMEANRSAEQLTAILDRSDKFLGIRIGMAHLNAQFGRDHKMTYGEAAAAPGVSFEEFLAIKRGDNKSLTVRQLFGYCLRTTTMPNFFFWIFILENEFLAPPRV